MEISLSSNSITDVHIATKFGTCHDSPAVVPCAKYCSDHFISIWMGAKWNFHHIWIVMEKLLVKWAPVPGIRVLAICITTTIMRTNDPGASASDSQRLHYVNRQLMPYIYIYIYHYVNRQLMPYIYMAWADGWHNDIYIVYIYMRSN